MTKICVLCLVGLITFSSCHNKTESIDEAETEIHRVMFCGIPFGINYNTKEVDGASVITSVVLMTSHQSWQDFEMIRDGISKRCGNPDVEEIESVDEEADRIYGRCWWGEAGITLRNVHSDEGGLMLVLQPNILPPAN